MRSHNRSPKAKLRGLALALILAGCTQQPEQIEPLRLAMVLQPSSALAIVAEAKGYFAEQRLQVEIADYPSGKRALEEGLLKGKVEVALTSEVPVALAALRGEPLRILATTFTASNVNRIVVRRDAGILRPLDLRGKRIATQKGSAVHYFLHLFLLDRGIDERQVQLSFADAEQLVPALAHGTIDAFSMREPYITQARQRLGDKVAVFAAPGIYRQFDLVVAAPEAVQQRKVALERLLRALQQAEQCVEQSPAEAQAIVARRLGTPVAAISADWPGYTFHLAMEQTLLLLLEDIGRWQQPDRPLPNYLELMSFDALERVKPQAITVVR